MGMRKCCIEGCTSNSTRTEDRGVTFHRFPVNQDIRKLWLDRSKMSATARLTKGTFVCSRHFRKVDFQKFKGTKYLLKPGMIPSIFPWSGDGVWSQEDIPNLPDDATRPSAAGKLEAPKVEEKVDEEVKEEEKVTKEEPKKEVKGQNKRSASADEANSSPKKKVARKTSDSAILKSPPIPEEVVVAPVVVPEKLPPIPVMPPIVIPKPVLNFVPGTKIEAQDFNEAWFQAKVVEVDADDREVLIHFEKNNKGVVANIPDEWISMDSSRLRAVQQHRKAPISFVVGEKCLARWSDARKFPGTVEKVLENDYYEVLFDDGYKKVVRANHMGKIRRSNPGGPNTGPPIGGGPSKLMPMIPGQSPVVLPQILRPDTVVIDWEKIPEQPEGEWSCHWFNDEPVGQESQLLYSEGRIVKTVIVRDSRLPEGWVKHVFQRTGILAKWEAMLTSPSGRVFRNKNEMKAYLEELGQTYNPEIYDFSLHRRRAKELGLCRYTPDYFNTAHIRLEKKMTAADKKLLQEKEIVDEAAALTGFVANSETPNKDSVMIGSIKVQIIDNLFRCPKEGCFKNFRKENHVQIHIKHYHKEMAELLGVCPNMTDLAYLRTIGTPTDDSPLPKNHLPNNQFFERVHQNDLSTKALRKSIGMASSAETSLVNESADISDTKLDQSVDEKPPKKLTILEEVLNSKPPASIEKGYFLKKEIAAGPLSTSDKPDQIFDPEQLIKTHALPKSSASRTKFGKVRKLPKPRSNLTKSKKFYKSHVTVEEENLSVLNDETRHSFENMDASAVANKRQKFLNQQFSMESSLNESNSLNTSLAELSQSPQYIQEDGEVIKIVRMRQEEIINCLCGFSEEDGLMIQCELCLCWQHGVCNGFERGSEVPDKYICYICRHPHRGRSSMKYKHDQEWLFEGRLPTINPNETFKRSKRYNLLKQSHTLTANLLELKGFLHSLKIKMSIAEKKEHPKMYLWSKKWETSPPPTTRTAQNFGIEPLKQPQIKVDTKIEKNPELGHQILQPIPQQPEEKAEDVKEEIKVEDAKKEEMKDENAELLSGLLQTPGGTNIDLIKMTEEKKEERAKTPTPNVPMPEAPIDSAECQARLLEHIYKQQTIAMGRMQAIEEQITNLESFDETSEKLENEKFTRTKQTIQMLMKDLITMRKIATVNSNEVYGTFI